MHHRSELIMIDSPELKHCEYTSRHIIDKLFLYFPIPETFPKQKKCLVLNEKKPHENITTKISHHGTKFRFLVQHTPYHMEAKSPPYLLSDFSAGVAVALLLVV